MTDVIRLGTARRRAALECLRNPEGKIDYWQAGFNTMHAASINDAIKLGIFEEREAALYLSPMGRQVFKSRMRDRLRKRPADADALEILGLLDSAKQADAVASQSIEAEVCALLEASTPAQMDTLSGLHADGMTLSPVQIAAVERFQTPDCVAILREQECHIVANIFEGTDRGEALELYKELKLAALHLRGPLGGRDPGND